jgi:lipocalin-like protein
MKKRIFALTVLAVVLSHIGSAQSREMLVGTWRLVSAANVTDKGIVKDEPYGRNPTGFLTYTPDGRMMALVTWGERKPLSKGQFATPTEERAVAFSTSFAYAGTFTLSDNRVTHHIEAATIPNWVKTDFVRTITELQGDRVTLRTGRLAWDDGVLYAYQEVTWERVK